MLKCNWQECSTELTKFAIGNKLKNRAKILLGKTMIIGQKVQIKNSDNTQKEIQINDYSNLIGDEEIPAFICMFCL